jgi:pilus assembly protein CpaB
MKVARLVVLGIAVAAGGTAALLAGRSAGPPAAPTPAVAINTVEILVATKDINIGQVVSSQNMGWLAWPTASASSQFVRKTDRAGAIEQLTGSIARAPIASGEPVRESKLIDAKGSGYMAAILPAGKRAISTEISAETGAGGFILPNDHVDVILARRDQKAGSAEANVSETLLNNIPVLAIDQTTEEKNGMRVVVGKTATLEVTPPQAEELARARLLGTISLSLRSLVDSKGSSPDVIARPPVAPVAPPSVVVMCHPSQCERCRPLQCDRVNVIIEEPTPLAQDVPLEGELN